MPPTVFPAPRSPRPGSSPRAFPIPRRARHAQRGIALWWLALIAVVIVLAMAYGSRIVSPYYNHYIMNRTVHDVLQEAQQDGLSSSEVKDRLIKRFQMDQTMVSANDIDVESAGDAITVDIDNPVSIPLYGNATLDLDLSVHQSTASGTTSSATN